MPRATADVDALAKRHRVQRHVRRDGGV